MTKLHAERSEAQSHLFAGQRRPDCARMWFVRFSDPDGARAWLARIAQQVAFGAPDASKVDRNSDRVQLAFSYEGLSVLQADGATLDAFPDAFRQGMRKRARQLGDPVLPTGPSVHAILTVLVHLQEGEVDQKLRALLLEAGRWARTGHGDVSTAPFAALREQLAQRLPKWLAPEQGGVEVLATHDLHCPLVEVDNQVSYGVEYFGFRDGLRKSEPDVTEHQKHFLVESEHALLHEGSYLVVRQLQQDVQAFWKAMALAGGERQDDFAEHVMGIQHNGDAFADKYKTACPFQSHVQRVNPLPHESLDKNPRIIRRGLSYLDADNKLGLMFMAYGADIENQFELIQHSWIQRGNHVGGASSDRDPIAGLAPSSGQERAAASFSCTFGQSHVTQSFAAFVRLCGGEYLFAPSKGGLASLLAAKQEARRVPVALAEYARPHPMELALAHAASDTEKRALVRGWLDKAESASTFWAHVRAQGGLRVTNWVFAGHPDDTHDIMSDRGKTFSVAEYARRMRDTTDRFFLGMDAHTKLYAREHKTVAIIPQDARSIAGVAREAAQQLLTSWSRRIKLARITQPSFPARLQVVELVAFVLDRVITRFIGLRGPGYLTFASWGGDVANYHFRIAADETDAARLGVSALSYRAHVDRGIRDADDALASPTPNTQVDAAAQELAAQRQALQRTLQIMRDKLPDAVHEDLARNLLNIVTGSLGATIKLTKTSLLAYARARHDANGFVRWPEESGPDPERADSLFQQVVATTLTEVQRGAPDSLYRTYVRDRPRRLRKLGESRWRASGVELARNDLVVAWIGGGLQTHGAEFLFGAGPHACPGRVMATAMIDGMLQALAPLQLRVLDEPDELQLELSDASLLGLERLPQKEGQAKSLARAPGRVAQLARALSFAALTQKLGFLQLRQRNFARRQLT